jgi:hypothetical protein
MFQCVSRVQQRVTGALQVMESGPFVNWISRNISTASEIFDLCAAAARSPTPMLYHAYLDILFPTRSLGRLTRSAAALPLQTCRVACAAPMLQSFRHATTSTSPVASLAPSFCPPHARFTQALHAGLPFSPVIDAVNLQDDPIVLAKVTCFQKILSCGGSSRPLTIAY